MGIKSFFLGHKDQPTPESGNLAEDQESVPSGAVLTAELEEILSEHSSAIDAQPLADESASIDSKPAELAVAPESAADFNPTEKELTELQIGAIDRLGGGINTTQIVQLVGDGGAVFKPISGEATYYRVGSAEIGGQCHRERAGYLVSSHLGFELAPATVIRAVQGEIGSLQDFAENGREINEGDVSAIEYQKLWIFDCLIFNTDRHSRNILHDDGRLIAIDNGMAFREKFGEEIRPFRVLWCPGTELDPTLRQQISDSLTNGAAVTRLVRELSCLLPEEEIADFQSRIEWLRDCLTQPKPSIYPWNEFSGSPFVRKYQPQ